LSKQLSTYFKAVYVAEYSREYLKEKGLNYNLDDVIAIASGQLQREEHQAGKAVELLFCDTDPLVDKIWCEVVFGSCPFLIAQQFSKHVYDLYLLCYPDIIWEPDPLRENPDNRLELFHLYEKTLKEAGFNYRVITGQGYLRIIKAINFVKEII